ncbi:hypothetical protein D3C85_1755700 [compost metagenome]
MEIPIVMNKSAKSLDCCAEAPPTTNATPSGSFKSFVFFVISVLILDNLAESTSAVTRKNCWLFFCRIVLDSFVFSIFATDVNAAGPVAVMI